jgi:hypothetical protein
LIGGTFLAGQNVNFHATRLSFLRRVVTRTNTNASTQRQRFNFASSSIGSGVAINFAIFIGWPQQEQGAFASSLILPPVGTPGASTRGADIVTATLASLGVPASGACTVLWSGVLPQLPPSGVVQVIANLDDGSATNRFRLRTNLGGSNIIVSQSTSGGEFGSSAAGVMTPGAPFRAGMVVRGDGTVGGSFNGGSVQSVSSGPTSGLTTLRLGRSFDGGEMHGETLALRVLPYVLSDTDLAAAVAAMPT